MNNILKLIFLTLFCLTFIGCGQKQPTPDTGIGVEPQIIAQLLSARLDDVDSSGDDSAGDKVIMTFDEDVTIEGASTTAANELILPVSGDSLGVNPSVIAGPKSTQVTLILGAGSKLLLTGTYDSTSIHSKSASGLKIAINSKIITVASKLAAKGEADIDSSLSPGFVAGDALNEARGFHTATALDDGRILVVGGKADSLFSYSSEIWDNGTWTDTKDESLGGPVGGAMIAQNANGQKFYIGRYDHTATKLADGRVLIVGGKGFEGELDASGNALISELKTSFIFDPVSNTFSPTVGSLYSPRSGHFAVPLNDGRVLIAGGYDSTVLYGQGGTINMVEVFDPETSVFTPLPQMNLPRQAGSAHLLPNGNILFVGGHLFAATQLNPTSTLYLAPFTETYSLEDGGVDGPALAQAARRYHSSVNLPNGDFLLFGGDDGSDGLDLITRYNSSAGVFENAGVLNSKRAFSQASTVADGIIIIGGAVVDYSNNYISNIASGEFYNPTTQSSQSYSMLSERIRFRTVAVGTNKVMAIGGFSGSTTSINGSDGTALASCEFFLVP